MPRLTPDERKAIFDAYEAGGCTQYDLAAEYGVTQGAIYYIVKGTNRARDKFLLSEQGMKRCSRCKEAKVYDDYYIQANKQASSTCKACTTARHKEYYLAHKEEIDAKQTAASKKRYDENSAPKRMSNQTWRLKNMARFEEYTRERRLKLRGAFVEHVDFASVVERDNNICGICNQFVDAADRSLDHVIPIARGGTHEYNNVQLAHLRCNKSKGARLTGQGVM